MTSRQRGQSLARISCERGGRGATARGHGRSMNWGSRNRDDEAHATNRPRLPQITPEAAEAWRTMHEIWRTDDERTGRSGAGRIS
jgi:hypothetical protein